MLIRAWLLFSIIWVALMSHLGLLYEDGGLLFGLLPWIGGIALFWIVRGPRHS